MFDDMMLDARVYGWQVDAKCAEPDGEDIFFPSVNENNANREDGLNQAVGKARALCDVCPVKRECSLMSLGERYGIWAGVGYKPRLAWKKIILGLGYDSESARGWAANEMKKADGDINKVIENNPLLAVIPGMVQDV